MLSRLSVIAGLLFAAVLGTQPAHSQKATEVYIPIGDSPGVSESHSVMGTISRVDYASRNIEVRNRAGARNMRVSDKTRYYLDRSKYGKKNALGSIRDCERGRRVEIYVGASGEVRWIKIEVD